MSGTYYDGTARNYSYLYDRSMYTSMWVAYPLYASTFEGTSAYSGSWAAATGNGFGTGNSNGYQINVWSASYNVFVGETDYSETVNDNSGRDFYARGHQIPDADRQYNSTMVQQTYYGINSTPQIQNGFNGGIWQKLEGAVRIGGDTRRNGAVGTSDERCGVCGGLARCVLCASAQYYVILFSCKQGRAKHYASQDSCQYLFHTVFFKYLCVLVQ